MDWAGMVFSRLCFCEKVRGGLAWIRRADLQTGFQGRDEENLVRRCDSAAARFLIHHAGLRTCFRGPDRGDAPDPLHFGRAAGRNGLPGPRFCAHFGRVDGGCLPAIPGLDILRDLELMAGDWALDHVFDGRARFAAGA